jgi:hypothetical protein
MLNLVDIYKHSYNLTTNILTKLQLVSLIKECQTQGIAIDNFDLSILNDDDIGEYKAVTYIWTFITEGSRDIMRKYGFVSDTSHPTSASTTSVHIKTGLITIENFDYPKICKAAAYHYHKYGELVFKYIKPFVHTELLIRHAGEPTGDTLNVQVGLRRPEGYVQPVACQRLCWLGDILQFFDRECARCRDMLELYRSANLADEVVPDVCSDDFVLLRQLGNKPHLLVKVGDI